ncbi:hypothetical protein MMG00_12000 [Ignatzschineria rhizosphaerae]|uniref:Uncharacterized protein n=1 Tax=Ignatzschineria rhizosphaerae TaxID=2923279 RepID=A0ABY3WZ60_9GAMM|nr:hypothetical protein [Ignatzschineria rhizosphaerae]UNM95907.1 hypothetical protein MMG00_12000 [Ignatzschineria rhizosphaerae]
MSETKKITVWIQPRWIHEGYTEEIDTDILLSDWKNMTEEEREEAGDEAAKEEFINMVEYGWS